MLSTYMKINKMLITGELYKSIKSGIGKEVRCPGCQKNFSTINNQKTLIPTNKYFISAFECSEMNDNLLIFYKKYKAYIQINNEEMHAKNKYVLLFNQQKKYIRFEKSTKKFFFKGFVEEEVEFDLDQVIKYTNEMFKEDCDTICGIYNLHIYINLIAKNVIDANNINVVNELLSEIRGTTNNAGLSVIKKIVSIFFGIIKYSNLSTIALTKDSNFLYDLMLECDIPDSQAMIESQATSPMKIFNFLIKNYIQKINEEVNEDNKEKHEFTFKSKTLIHSEEDPDKVFVKTIDKEAELKISYKINDNYKTKVQNDMSSGAYEVLKISDDANASKFIFKKIRNFSDFKKILKYFKFYNKQEIIELLQKYNLDLLIEVIDIIYFRDRADIKELSRILDLISDFIKTKTLEIRPVINKSDLIINYGFVKEFDFSFYDDCIMMMEVLEFDPKRHFLKIRKYSELLQYHDNLVRFFNVVSDKEKSKKFKDFVDRFRFLESKEDYDGPLSIKLIDSPGMLIKEGVIMKHSASSYSKKVISNIYLIGQVYDNTENIDNDELKRFTIGFTFHNIKGLEFDQVKGFGNKQGSDRFKKLLMEFLTIKDISYRPIKDLKIQNEFN